MRLVNSSSSVGVNIELSPVGFGIEVGDAVSGSVGVAVGSLASTRVCSIAAVWLAAWATRVRVTGSLLVLMGKALVAANTTRIKSSISEIAITTAASR